MRGQLITAVCLVVLGLVWIGQGIGLLRSSSFMTDDPFWAVVGLGFVAAGIVFLVIAWRSRRTG